MITDKRNIVENEILKIANKLLDDWSNKLIERKISVTPLTVYNNSSADNYFSEIEFNLWKDNELLETFSVIIYIEGRQVLFIENAYDEINNEIKVCLGKAF